MRNSPFYRPAIRPPEKPGDTRALQHSASSPQPTQQLSESWGQDRVLVLLLLCS